MGLLSSAIAGTTAENAEAKSDIAEAMGVEDYVDAGDIAIEEQPYIVQDEAEETAEEEPAGDSENSSSVEPGQQAEGDASEGAASGTPESPVQEGEQAGSESGQPGASDGQLAELTGGRFTRVVEAVQHLQKQDETLKHQESVIGRQGQELGQLRAKVKQFESRAAVDKAARHFEDLTPEEQADVTREARQRGVDENEVLHDRYLLAQMDARTSERESKQLAEQRGQHRDRVDAWLAQQYDTNPDAKQAIDNVSSWFPDTFARLMDDAPAERMVDEIQNLVALGWQNHNLTKENADLKKQLEKAKADGEAKAKAAVEIGKKAAYDDKEATRKQAAKAASEATRGSATTGATSARESQPHDLGAALERHGQSQGGFLKRAMQRSKANK